MFGFKRKLQISGLQRELHIQNNASQNLVTRQNLKLQQFLPVLSKSYAQSLKKHIKSKDKIRHAFILTTQKR